MGPSYSVEWVDEGLHYSFREDRIDRHPRLFERLDGESLDWLAFWSAAEFLRLDQWAPRYENPDVMDGTVWGVELRLAGGATRPDLCVASSGSNRYPSMRVDRTVPGGDPGTDDSGEVFTMWCEAVATLVGRPFQ